MTKTLTLQLPNERKGKKIREKNLRDQTVQPTKKSDTDFHVLLTNPILSTTSRLLAKITICPPSH